MNYRLLLCGILFLRCTLFAGDRNLVIIVDNLHQETIKTEEINMTHQCITSLQQRASCVLVSTNLWKNIIDRKYKFEKQLQDSTSLESAIFDMYQTTNKELHSSRYNLAVVNQKLSQIWFVQKYPQLAELSSEKLNQLRFDFLCYMFKFNIDQWRVYNANEGMLLFMPQELQYHIDEAYVLTEERALLKHADKKSFPVESMQKLLPMNDDQWVIYLTGHGHPKSAQQGANIAGLKIDEFKKILHHLNSDMHVKLFVYSSCYGGGVHTVEPYANVQLHYPVIVTAVTDAPIFGFGLFEGVKLPPYDQQFKLQAADVAKNSGLLPFAIQNFSIFFKRAWKGQFDLNLIQSISRFFTCDMMLCHVQKVENFPLIRKAHEIIFTPMRDSMMLKLVQQVTTNTVVTATKPLLLYTKKIKKIKLDSPWSIISMLPGIQSHEIGELVAPYVTFSQLIAQSFVSLEDMQAYKNFMIKKLTCMNDVIAGHKKIENFTNVLILHQEDLMPKFLHQPAQALIYAQRAGKHYLIIWNDGKVDEIIELDQEQIETMFVIEGYVQQSVNYDVSSSVEQLLTFDSYIENKAYQQEIVNGCVKSKVCKK
ncbi:MAG: hypothetical protein Q8Q60_04460 [Candidatus Chromulinivorax sp.]|nr:hypothetical protein [Candidatus Chromulinivorax sp.]